MPVLQQGIAGLQLPHHGLVLSQLLLSKSSLLLSLDEPRVATTSLYPTSFPACSCLQSYTVLFCPFPGTLLSRFNSMGSHLSTENAQFILLGKFPCEHQSQHNNGKQGKLEQASPFGEYGFFCCLEPCAECAAFGQLP